MQENKKQLNEIPNLFDVKSHQEFLFYCWSVVVGDLTKKQLEKLLFDEYELIVIDIKTDFANDGFLSVKARKNESNEIYEFSQTGKDRYEIKDFRLLIHLDASSKTDTIDAINNIKSKYQKYEQYIRKQALLNDGQNLHNSEEKACLKAIKKLTSPEKEVKEIWNHIEMNEIILKTCWDGVVEGKTAKEMETYFWDNYQFKTTSPFKIGLTNGTRGNICCEIGLSFPHEDYLISRNYGTNKRDMQVFYGDEREINLVHLSKPIGFIKTSTFFKIIEELDKLKAANDPWLYEKKKVKENELITNDKRRVIEGISILPGMVKLFYEALSKIEKEKNEEQRFEDQKNLAAEAYAIKNDKNFSSRVRNKAQF